MFVVCASNQSGSFGGTATTLQYTKVNGPNQSGLSWDRPPGTPIYYNRVLVCTVCVEMTFLVLLFYILKYLLQRSTTYCYI